MSHDLVLVTGTAPTRDDLVEAAARLGPQVLSGLLVDGDFGDTAGAHDEVPVPLTVASRLDADAAFLSVHAPVRVGPAASAPWSAALGVDPPADAEGRCWLTHMSMPADADDDRVQAVLRLLAPLALRHHGHLVVNGEPTPLPAVPAPQARAATEPADRPPPLGLFLAARLDLGVTDGDDGWRTVMRHLGQVLADPRARDLLTPGVVQVEGAWQRLDQRSAPPWWPAEQKLARADPRVLWQVSGAGYPGDRFSGLQGGFALPPERGSLLLERLLALAPYGLAYGFVHAWTADEPTGPSGFTVESRRRYDPHLSVLDVDLARQLPTLYWAQVLGPPWVELIGADRIAATPAHRVEEVGDGRWLVQLTPSLAEVVADYPAYAATRARCKEHLGADLFWRRGETGRAAYLPTLLERGLVPPPPSLEELAAGER